MERKHALHQLENITEQVGHLVINHTSFNIVALDYLDQQSRDLALDARSWYKAFAGVLAGHHHDCPPSFEEWASFTYISISKHDDMHQAVSEDLESYFQGLLQIYQAFLLECHDELKTLFKPIEVHKYANNQEVDRFWDYFKQEASLAALIVLAQDPNHTGTEALTIMHFLKKAIEIGKILLQGNIAVDLDKIKGAAFGLYVSRHLKKSHHDDELEEGHDSWLSTRGLLYMQHILDKSISLAFNLESLSAESLILMYCQVTEDHKSLELDRPLRLPHSPARNKNERLALLKLEDFAAFVLELKHNTHSEIPLYSLLHGDAITKRYRLLAVEHNVGIMHFFRDEVSLNALLEEARTEDDHHKLRGYLAIFNEYAINMTMRQKSILLQFLFERLTHSEEDIREYCARMMGVVVANSEQEASLTLLRDYFKRFIEAEVSTTPKHRNWIGLALSFFIRALLENAQESTVVNYTQIVLDHFDYYRKTPQAHGYLLRVLKYLPLERCQDALQLYVLSLVYKMALQPNVITRLEALDAINRIVRRMNQQVVLKMNYHMLFDDIDNEYHAIFSYLQSRIDQNKEALRADVAAIYLSNLKSATPAIVKRLQIDMLLSYMQKGDVEPFHAAMHFSNVLKVSAYQEVRERAGQALVSMFHRLPAEQRNDIVIELLRALEIEGYQFTKYIPPYLGVLINALSASEHIEIVEDLVLKMKSASRQICLLVLSTAAHSLVHQLTHGADDSAIRRLFSVLLNGMVHYDSQVSQGAFSVIGHDVFGSEQLNLDHKRRIYALMAKKILTIITQQDDPSPLHAMHYAASLNHMYRFVVDAIDEGPKLDLECPNKIAFFPGSFDPFSLAHKASACRIRDLGFEVYLAVDEFSWSKRTQPNLVRRNIVKMSIADELHIHTFPRSLIVNIGNVRDIENLIAVFSPRETYLVMGSDVLTHASAYQGGQAQALLFKTSHIVFERAQGLGNERDNAKLEQVLAQFEADVIRLTLTPEIETISSTQIRTFVDQNRDISDLTEGLVQKYIYEKGLYKREPQFKDAMTVRSLSVEIVDSPTPQLIEEIAYVFSLDSSNLFNKLYSPQYAQASRVLLIRDLTQHGRIQACAMFHWLRSSMIYHEIESGTLNDYVRQNAVGRIVVIDALLVNPQAEIHSLDQGILTETLAFCLSKDYSYAVYRNTLGFQDQRITNRLQMNGFKEIKDHNSHKIYVVDMSNPIVLSFDCKSMIKAPYRNDEIVEKAIEESRASLCQALCDFYPGHLVLAFDRTMIYEHLIKLVCDANQVPTEPLVPRQLGNSMLVPYGDVFKRWILPNTVTKALHTERYYNEQISQYTVKAYPQYLDLDIQARTIKSFNRPVILVDDLLDKGYRLKAVLNHFSKHEVPVKQIDVGILSGRGKAWVESQGLEVRSAYFIPRIRLWFNESHIYPMIGGDAIAPLSLGTPSYPSQVLPSVNLILPYVYPKYIKQVGSEKVAAFSKVCLENSHRILRALESVYLERHERNLTVNALPEVLLSPRCPEKGNLHHALVPVQNAAHAHIRPTELLQADLGWLKRIKPYYTHTERGESK